MNDPAPVPLPPASRQELPHLLSAWADDALSDSEFARLDALLQSDPQARRAYRHYVHLGEQLGELVVPSLAEAVTSTRCTGASEAVASNPEAAGSTNADRGDAVQPLSDRLAGPGAAARPIASEAFLPRTTRSWRGVLIGGGATAALVAWSVWFVGTPPAGPLAGGDPRGRPAAVGAQAVPGADAITEGLPDDSDLPGAGVQQHVAIITNVEQAVWGASMPTVGVGSALGLQTISLISGRVDLDFAGGAKVFLRGPTEFSLLSDSRGMLHFGELAAQVRDGAEGFVIDTPSVEVVDLGTEFGVSVNRAGVADLHVIKGAVEARTTGLDERPGALFRLEASQALRFVPDAPAPTAMTYDASLFPALVAPADSQPQTRGAVCLLQLAPETVEPDKHESDDFILLFLERASVPLHRPIPVTFRDPGRHTQFRGKATRVPAGTHVSTYLLHFDSVSREGRPHRLRLDGSVTFPRPILGVIAGGKQLLLTDRVLGNPGTNYGDQPSRGLDSRTREDTDDIVTLSEDRRTLDLSFSVRRSCDQLRVLIAAPAPAEVLPADL